MFEDVQRLIERCIEREEKAWEEFVERFSGLLFYSARERLKRNGIAFSQQDLEDVVQTVFVEIWQGNKLQEVRDRKKIKAWLSIVAQTRALNHVYKKKERLLRENELYRIDNIKVEPGPGSGKEEEALAGKLEEMIEGFEAREKIILKLSVIYGKKHREIAALMQMPVNTVSTVIARKKKILRSRLKKLKERE